MIAAAPVTVPFTVFDNRILVQTTIDGVPGFTMILDTGAHGVGVTPETARALHVRVIAAGTIAGAGAQRARVGQTGLTDVSIGPRDLGKQSALVVDLSTIRRAFGFPHLDGIVGYDALRASYVQIDSDKRLMTVSDSAIIAPPAAHHTPFSVRDGLLHVAASVDGFTGDFILDTGDRSSLTLFSRFAQRNGFYNISQATRNIVTGYGIGGPIHSNVFASHLSAFGYDLPNVRTRVPVGNAGVFSSSTDSGSIGNGVLLRFTTLYDRVHGDIAVWQNGPTHVFRAER
ncbi:MAG TPA: aspartyl protease family protein [Candidatus Baltobacteraceae bacterium]|jgi:predicted aspartyl protease|nr:aspartyl protease family protein [Candidatus Baltobacteraceae bacterium]